MLTLVLEGKNFDKSYENVESIDHLLTVSFVSGTFLLGEKSSPRASNFAKSSVERNHGEVSVVVRPRELNTFRRTPILESKTIRSEYRL